MNDYWVNLGCFESGVIDVAVAAPLSQPARVEQHLGGFRRQAFLQQLSIPSGEQLLGSVAAGGQAVAHTLAEWIARFGIEGVVPEHTHLAVAL